MLPEKSHREQPEVGGEGAQRPRERGRTLKREVEIPGEGDVDPEIQRARTREECQREEREEMESHRKGG